MPASHPHRRFLAMPVGTVEASPSAYERAQALVGRQVISAAELDPKRAAAIGTFGRAAGAGLGT